MTLALAAKDVIARLAENFPGAVEEAGRDALLVKAESLLDVLTYLKSSPEFDFDFFNFVTAADYYQYFEIIYHLNSVKHNHSIFVKARCYSRDNPSLPSVVSLWQGADFQEREIFDLFGIKFEGHPNLKRIFLWEGFQGYPLRKDFNR
jgi:NADH-quinone oxidoreductase subunit C